MNNYTPTNVAIAVASMRRDSAFIEADLEDEAINNKILAYECKMEGTTIEEMDANASDDEKRAFEEVIEQIPIDPNDDHEQLMRIMQHKGSSMSIDEAMGISTYNEDAVLEELTNFENFEED